MGGYYPGYSSTTVVYEVAADTEPVAEVEAEVETEEERLARLTQRHLELGDFYFKQGRFEEAAESYMRALAYSPDDGSIHFVIADSLFAQGDYHYAAFMIKKALELDPELAQAEVDKRSFYEDPALFDRQMETLRKYLEEKPYDAAAHLVMGFNLRFSGDSAGAKLALARVLEIDPDSRAAQLLLDSATKERESASATPPRAAEPESRPSKK
ncbi:MAG: tetratricopeptide repeat protein [Planctomycetota bacterium]